MIFELSWTHIIVKYFFLLPTLSVSQGILKNVQSIKKETLLKNSIQDFHTNSYVTLFWH